MRFIYLSFNNFDLPSLQQSQLSAMLPYTERNPAATGSHAGVGLEDPLVGSVLTGGRQAGRETVSEADRPSETSW